MSLSSFELDNLALRRLASQQVVRLSNSLDRSTLAGLKNICSTFDFVKKDSHENYFGFALQTSTLESEANAAVHHVSAAEPRHLAQRYFDQLRPEAAALKFIWNFFPRLRLVRGRVLKADPGAQLDWHIDFPMHWRLHLPLVSYPEAKIEFKDQSYHLPADGSFYLVNGRFEHRMRNFSAQSRTHIVFEVMCWDTLNDLKNHSL